MCEKPLALSCSQADILVRTASETGRLLTVNHMLRYSPLLEFAKAVVEEQLLGEPRHAFFENYAGDEQLSPMHWFWDRRRSGGIFLEHTVHFFDLHDWWFGSGEVLAAHAETRPGTEQQDRVWCQARYEGGTLVRVSTMGSIRPTAWTGPITVWCSSEETWSCKVGCP